MDKIELEKRTDALAIAYVTSRENVSDMSVEEFFETYKKVHNEIHELLTSGQ